MLLLNIRVKRIDLVPRNGSDHTHVKRPKHLTEQRHTAPRDLKQTLHQRRVYKKRHASIQMLNSLTVKNLSNAADVRFENS